MMQSLPLSHSIYSRISKDCIQSFTKLNYPSFSVYSGLKSTISTVPRNKLSLKDRLKRAVALLSCVGLLTVAKPRAHCGEGDSNSSGGDSSRAGGADRKKDESDDPNGKPDPVADLIGQVFPHIQKLGFGGVLGVCSAAAFKKYGKLAAAYIGIAFVAFQALQQAGYIKIDYGKVQEDTQKLLDVNGDGKLDVNDIIILWNKVKDFLSYQLPGAGGFSAGFVIGLKYF